MNALQKPARSDCVDIDSSLREKKIDEDGFASSPLDDTACAVVYLLSSEAKAVNGQTTIIGK